VKADGDGAGLVLQEVSEPAQPEAAPVTRPDDRSAAGDDRRAGAGDDGRTDDGRWAAKGVVPRADAKTIWVLVADEAIARILRWPEQGDTLESVEELTDPAAHAKEGDFNRDAQGRRAGVAPHGSRQNTPHRLRSTSSVTASAGEEDRHLEAQGFARRVAMPQAADGR
jgi:hypothetical protein